MNSLLKTACLLLALSSFSTTLFASEMANSSTTSKAGTNKKQESKKKTTKKAKRKTAKKTGKKAAKKTERKVEQTSNRAPAQEQNTTVTLPSIRNPQAVPEYATVNIFKSKSWYVAPPPPPEAPPPPPPVPTAPPLPYTFMGSYQGKDGRLIIFLTKGDRIYSVSPGDVIDGTYKVDEIGSGQITLIYLPLNIRQTLSIGDKS